jgi:hypothetical protein
MSDHSEQLIDFEEQNYMDLAEKFIDRNYTKPVISWEDFVFEQWEQYNADRNWEPDV